MTKSDFIKEYGGIIFSIVVLIFAAILFFGSEYADEQMHPSFISYSNINVTERMVDGIRGGYIVTDDNTQIYITNISVFWKMQPIHEYKIEWESNLSMADRDTGDLYPVDAIRID